MKFSNLIIGLLFSLITTMSVSAQTVDGRPESNGGTDYYLDYQGLGLEASFATYAEYYDIKNGFDANVIVTYDQRPPDAYQDYLDQGYYAYVSYADYFDSYFSGSTFNSEGRPSDKYPEFEIYDGSFTTYAEYYDMTYGYVVGPISYTVRANTHYPEYLSCERYRQEVYASFYDRQEAPLALEGRPDTYQQQYIDGGYSCYYTYAEYYDLYYLDFDSSFNAFKQEYDPSAENAIYEDPTFYTTPTSQFFVDVNTNGIDDYEETNYAATKQNFFRPGGFFNEIYTDSVTLDATEEFAQGRARLSTDDINGILKTLKWLKQRPVLGNLNCTNDQIAKYDGSAWVCATESGGAYTAGTGIDITSSVISIAAVSSTEITDGTIALSDIADLMIVESTEDVATGEDAGGVANDLHVGAGVVGDTAIPTAKAVTDYVTAQLASQTDADTLGGLSCSADEIAKWNGSAWACATDGGGSGGKFVDGTDTSEAVYTTGNVGIGTTDPTEALHVVGAVFATEGLYPSDLRLKKNILPVQDALDKISQFRGVSYEWKDEQKHGVGTRLGVIAQEVELVFPEVVRNHDNGEKSVNYSDLIGPVIESIKELKTQNEDLRAEIETLKAAAGYCTNP